jgi:hypothetical protein
MTKLNQGPMGAATELPRGPASPVVEPGEQLPGEMDGVAKQPVGVTGSAVDMTRIPEELHQYVREYIRNADQKAAFFFAASTAALTFLVKRGTIIQWLCSPCSWGSAEVSAFVATVGLTVSVSAFLSVVFPRLSSSAGNGIFFFGAIASSASAREYAVDVAGLPVEEVARQKLEHVYELACVCRSKFHALVVGFWSGAIGAVGALLYLAIANT